MTNEPKIVKAFTAAPYIEEWTNLPEPASKGLPEWYKKIPRYSREETGKDWLTVKACLPYLDAMSAGYVLKTWCDITVSKDEETGNTLLTWNNQLAPAFEKTEESHTGMARMPGFTEWKFGWNMPWSFEMPEGYSALITTPLNRPDLPFIIASGITDMDKFPLAGVATFCVNESFEGVVPAGTPYMQIIPIKRDDFTLKIDQELRNHETKRYDIALEEGVYKKKWWTKKDYS
jgi:hypothetical protein